MPIAPETKIGLVVLGGLIILAVSILSLGEVRFQKGYEIKVFFNDIGGLPEKSPVKSAGVEIGNVKEITLRGNKAEVTVWIKKKIEVREDAKVRIVSTGMIGTKYIEMTLGTSMYPPLIDGDFIEGIDPLNFDKLVAEGMSGFMDLADAIKGFAGDDDFKTSLVNVVKNLKEITDVLKTVLQTEEGDMAATIKNIKQFSEKINVMSDHLRELANNLNEATKEGKIQETMENIRIVSEKLNSTLDSIHVIAERIEQGQGTMGKLISDEEMGEEIKIAISNLKDAAKDAKEIISRVQKVETYWDYQANYNFDDEEFRNDFGIRLKPNSHKFYYIGGSNIQDANGLDYDQDGHRINSLTAEIGREFGPFTLYGGMIRSSGGFGASYRPFQNRVFELNVEAFDFSREVDGDTKAWVNAGGKFKITDWCYFKANVEDMLSVHSFNTSLNLVMRDDDLAYLLGLTGISSLAK